MSQKASPPPVSMPAVTFCSRKGNVRHRRSRLMGEKAGLPSSWKKQRHSWRVASASTPQNHAEGAPGPSPLGTGETPARLPSSWRKQRHSCPESSQNRCAFTRSFLSLFRWEVACRRQPFHRHLPFQPQRLQNIRRVECQIARLFLRQAILCTDFVSRHRLV